MKTPKTDLLIEKIIDEYMCHPRSMSVSDQIVWLLIKQRRR